MIKLLIACSQTVTPTFEAITEEVIGSYAPDPSKDLPASFICEVICADTKSGSEWGRRLGIPIWYELVTREDTKHGKYLGVRMRNRRLADRADAALLFWDGLSENVSDVACRMLARGKPCRVVPTKKRAPKNPRSRDR